LGQQDDAGRTAPDVERWGLFEVALAGPAEGNPFVEVDLSAEFRFRNRTIRVPGFYDGDGTYRIRFMPDEVGAWTWTTSSTTPALDGRSGGFVCAPPGPGNHGPVRVRNRFHFAHADGRPYLPFGTTCYAWTHQPLDLQRRTRETLATSPFNKIRMGVFPKDYEFNHNEPLHPCFEPRGDGTLDFDRPHLPAFRHFEAQVAALRDLGVEADVILFHPYDRWRYSDMSEAQDFRYVAYLTARLAAYRNVWWSLANEYDFLLDTKPMARWDRFFQIIEENDPYRHLASIHNGDVTMNYDHRKPWVSHVCIQNWDVKKTPDWREAYGKPIVNDEPEYEGDIWPSWGSISGRELVHRFWLTVTRGGYAGHGETFEHPEDVLWWAKGGVLHGEAAPRIAFLRQIVEAAADQGFEPLGGNSDWPWNRVSGARDGATTLIYLGEHQPLVWSTGLPTAPGDHAIDVIDTWNMTTEPAMLVEPPVPHATRHGAVVRGGKADAAMAVRLPGRPGLAIRVRDLAIRS
jgi:hypothetical protein